jgi:CRISPR/Cas system-associated endoribonuclease Cas2
MMCVLMSTRKRMNRLQYSVCKCEVESTGKWSNVGVLFNQLHFNLVPKV